MRVPAEVFPAGEFIRDALEDRGWTQRDLAEIINRPIQVVNEIINGKKSITPETARELAAALGTSPELWLNLETAYRLKFGGSRSADIGKRATIYSLVPVAEMLKRQWIRKAASADELEKELLEFFAVNNLEDIPKTRQVAARAYIAEAGQLTPAQYTWCRQAIRLASGVPVAHYRRSAIAEGLPQLRVLMANPEEARKAPRVLAEMGVRFLLLQPLAGSRIDGAALWLPDGSPLVAVSTRFDRIDSFWFTLCHELAHIEAEDQQGALDTDLIGAKPGDLAESEKHADDRASEMLIPQKELASFIDRKRPYFYKDYIIQFASRIGVHPGIVVGQLQYRGEIDYNANREMLVKIRHIVAQEALTDGWGDTVAGF